MALQLHDFHTGQNSTQLGTQQSIGFLYTSVDRMFNHCAANRKGGDSKALAAEA